MNGGYRLIRAISSITIWTTISVSGWLNGIERFVKSQRR
jgi:hypothetical protein